VDYSHIQERVLAVCKRLPELYLVTGTAGNVSARDPGTGAVAIKPSGLPYDAMTAEDILVVDVAGKVLDNPNDLKPSFEMPSHLTLYRSNSEINGVIHTHSKYANTLGMVRDVIPCRVTPTARRLLQHDIPVIPFVENGTQEMADILATYCKEHVVIQIRNHGAFAMADSVELALERALAIEDAAQLYWQASLLGTPSLIPG
jgi:L-ribulose-5-phosphate 4-epimerase